MIRTLLFSCALALLVGVGCGGGESRLVGKYSASFEGGDEAEMAMAQMFASQMSLELKDDKTFEMAALGMTTTGTWSLESNVVKLKMDPSSDGFMVSDEDIELSVGSDGKTLKAMDKNAQPGEPDLVFTRQEE